jgi:molybdopterin synthase sulfur carrier subunit
VIEVSFLGPIKKETIYIEATSLKELAEILKKDDSLSEWLNISAIAVNDKIVKDKSFKLSSGDKVALLPPVCGG